MSRSTLLDRALPWLLRAVWVSVLVAGGAAIDSATADRSDAVAATATWVGGGLWLAGVASIVVPAVSSLAAARVILPLGPVAAATTWVAGAEARDAALFLVATVVATVIVLSADLGRTFVQASAYGNEARHPLRPPAPFALAAGITWCVWAAAAVSGPLLLAANSWIAGVPITLIAIGSAVWAWPRWHLLARRWFVLVPIGVVVHDPLVLAETFMLRRQELATIRLAPADTEAADLTGPAGGHAVEIVTNESVDAVLAGGRTEPRLIHLTACLIAPSRPGRALAEAAGRRFPVG